MTEETNNPEEEPKKGSRMVLILGLVLALAGGGGGFYAVYSGMILGADSHDAEAEKPMPDKALPDVAFVKIEPIIISLPPGSSSKYVRFSAQLEVATEHQDEVEVILPRVVDVLNSYLRAVEPADFDEPAALVKLRAQMLRRVQIVTGKGRVRDLLIMEFVLT